MVKCPSQIALGRSTVGRGKKRRVKSAEIGQRRQVVRQRQDLLPKQVGFHFAPTIQLVIQVASNLRKTLTKWAIVPRVMPM